MRKSLLPLLRSPDCDQPEWDLIVHEENEREIRSGELHCRNTQAVYRITDGVLNMIGKITEDVAHEKEHAESHGYLRTPAGESFPINRQTIEKFSHVFLSLPAGDGSELFRPGGSFDNQGGNAERFFKTLDLLKLTGKERILEVGASFGWASWRFAQKGCDVVALDISNYLMTANLYFEKDGTYFERMSADMNNLPFRDNTFDIIFSHSVIHHCKDLARLFKEFYRVLRPGGRVVALHECSFGLLEDKSGQALQEAIDEGFNENAYTIPQWKKGARDGGFEKTRTWFFSFIDDYLYRKKLRGARPNFKIRLAEWVRKYPRLHTFVNALSVPVRVLFRPKAWMLIATKHPK